MDYRGILLISAVVILLVCATVIIEYLRRRPTGIDASTLSTCRSRINAWWLLFGSLICALLLGSVATIFLFGAISFWALREYVTLTPTRPADHRTLVGVFFLLTPLQFILVGVDPEWFQRVFDVDSYFVYSGLIPTLVFLILPATIATSDDPKFFLERVAKLQVGLLICVYSLSFAPAMLSMPLPNSQPTSTAAEIIALDIEDKVFKPIEERVVALQNPSHSGEESLGDSPADDSIIQSEKNKYTGSIQVPSPRKKLDAANLTLLFTFVLLTQISDMAQYLWSLTFPSRKIAPHINSNKTVEGVILGALTTSLVAVGLWYFMPFAHWTQAAVAGLIVAVMGFAGNMTTSAIKRDRGVGDYGDLIDGHNGVLDRVDSLCFAAPLFFHYVKICLE